jgi:hypothetical protein
VRVSCPLSKQGRRAWLRARGDPGSSRHDGRHSDCGSGVPQGTTGRQSWSRGSNTGCASQGVRFVSFRSVLEPARRCPRRRPGMSEIGTCEVKAAPADEARAVRHSRHREVSLSKCSVEGSWSSRKRWGCERVNLGRIDRSWPVRIARPSCPTARTARTTRAGKGLSLRTRRCAARIQCAHHDARP